MHPALCQRAPGAGRECIRAPVFLHGAGGRDCKAVRPDRKQCYRDPQPDTEETQAQTCERGVFMRSIELYTAFHAIDDDILERSETAVCKHKNCESETHKLLKRRFPAALVAAVIMVLACTTIAMAAYFYHVYITNRNTELPSYDVIAELENQTISTAALRELKVAPYQTYKSNYAEAENYLGVDLLISEQLDSMVMGEGVDIQGSYVKGERPITSITLTSRHNTGSTMSGYIDMFVYMSIGTKKTYEQITQVLNPELLEKDAVLSEYVSETNGIEAKFAAYETIGYASAYFVDNGILYGISTGGFTEEDNTELTEYLKNLIDTFA